MYNWSTDEVKFKKKNPKGFAEWKLVQEINHGSENIKFDKNQIIDLWPKISQNLDVYKRRLIEYLIWGNLYSLPTSVTSWI